MADALERAGKPLPEWIENAPQPPEHQWDLWAAFHTLSDSRQMGMGPGPIPLSEIESYFRVFDVRDPDQIDEWITLIRQMDREYLQVASESHD